MARVSEGEVKVALEPRASGVVARVTIDRAGKANALNTALMRYRSQHGCLHELQPSAILKRQKP